MARAIAAVDLEPRKAEGRRDRRQAGEALRESETKFRALAETIAAAIFIYQDTRLRYVNSAAEALSGYRREELLAMSFWDLIHPDFRELVRERGQARQQGEQVPPRYELKIVTKSGEERWVDFTGGVTEFEGKPAVLGTAFDVTERKRAEEELRDSEEKYRDLVENISETIYALDKEGRITYVSPVVEQVGGYNPSELIGRSFTEFIYPDDLLPLIQSFQRTVSGNLEPSEYRILTKSGEIHWVRTSSRLVYEGDRIVGLRAVLMDITDRKRAEEALRESEERYRSLIETSPDAITLTDLSTNIIMVNRQAVVLHGCESAEEMIGRSALDFIAPEDRPRAIEYTGNALETGCVRNIEYTLLKKDGTQFPAELSASVIVDADGKPKAFIGVVRDITERKQAEEAIRHLAYHDALTGLPNRLLFQDRFTQALAQARRNKQTLAVMSLDLDRFKLVNDTLGHTVGDHLLQAVAERLAALVRETDTVARVGGDEFMLLLPGIARAEDVAKMAEKTLEGFGPPFNLDGQEVHATTSIGISLYPYDGGDAEILLRNADAAMYRAKEQGRNNYQLYTPAMNVKASQRLALENSLRRAVEREEFVVYYQPQANVDSGEIVGMEALVRWQHPERGLVLPGEFISLAEETGLIVPLGEWVLRTACGQNKAWQEAGLPPLRVAVNLSARQFQQPNLVDMVARALKETRLDAGYLELEITEGIAMQNADLTIVVLRDLREMGIRISIDDFGAGHSSLSYLKNFPIHTLKIDRSFVRDLTTDPNDAAIATAIIAMAHSLKLSVVAEGVETEDQLAFLKQGGCDKGQGYLLGRPMPAEAFETILRQKKRLQSRSGVKVKP